MKEENTDQQLIDDGYAEGKKSFEFIAKKIGKEFNFDMVYKAMLATEWSWSFGTDKNGIENFGIPTLQTIKEHAFYLLKKAYDEGGSISTGGFSAGWDGEDMYLLFQLEEASSGN